MSERGLSSLQLRVLSAAVLAPIAVAAVYLGAEFFALFLAIAAAAMCFEWCKASFIHNKNSYIFLVISWILFSIFLAYEEYVFYAFWCVIICAVALIALTWLRKEEREWKGAFIGPLYIGIPVLSLLEIREAYELGLVYTLTLFLIVWATDIGAYFFGRSIGGPKIAPSISPNKTWAGLIGGMICSAITAALCNAYLLHIEISEIWIALAGACLAVLAQVGDFFESGWKRHFGIKDASNLIPGHGGVLDRLDGVLFVAPALYGLIYLVGK
ncbi:phosphatidate cytidylyltransferase [Sneathiella limimaris]|uniref:phosphatidate cytidylyltransferase n=1 Tax=Sneathiella limimaris TaxID=1964213 RepID=UPI00146AC37E